MYQFDVKPHFPAIAVAKESGVLHFKNFQRLSISIKGTGLSPVLSSRAESTVELIKESDRIYGFKDFGPVVISVGDSDDHYGWGVDNSVRILNYCTRWDNFSDVCPDFAFDKWGEAGYENYDEFCDKVLLAGESIPENDCAVWRGLAGANKKVRNKILALAGNNLFDVKNVVSETGNPSDCVLSKDYMSIDEQVRKYRYIIDANGQGHSRRLKIQMFSGRVIFLVERRYEEWFYPELKPWVHYVPVKQDLSDLIENMEIVRSTPSLEQEIGNNSKQFALSNLKKENAIARFNYLFNIEKYKINKQHMMPMGRFTEMDCRDDDYRED